MCRPSVLVDDHPQCSCPECQAMCQRRPCWPTPAETESLIAAGWGGRLMLDWWFDHAQGRTVYVLTPAVRGREAEHAPLRPTGACTFLTSDNLCLVHNSGYMPSEGRLAMCGGRTPDGLHERIAETWNTEAGRELVARWQTWQERHGESDPRRR